MFKFLQNLFRSKPATPHQTEPTPEPEPAPTPETEKTGSVPVPNPQPATPPLPEREAEVLVQFNTNQGETLRPAVIMKTKLGAYLSLHIPVIQNYTFITLTGLTTRVTSVQQVVQLIYAPTKAAPVAIYCFDYDTNRLLGAPQFIDGNRDEPYHIELPHLPGYQLHFLAGDRDGIFTDITQTLVAYYRHDNWRLVQPVYYRVRIKHRTAVYPEPRVANPYPEALPAGSVWKVFKEVQVHHHTWLSLGGNEWIQATVATQLPENK
ncbi:MucBP domain-containing protein [Fructilactobacillus myrtifloralis]|uniref:MucBP domain-containing protein n=1 Tax=Fructilactobacillus myrtifloralis TaxID=2940301 RepID=A0ABY5BRK9_9LACO|nr:MucBP domain-containing protein [Fructilactobacillus myrtifloralis]USS85551.1 MucBP domain-containing protein [Fructilactobacillus myrtifloralis]